MDITFTLFEARKAKKISINEAAKITKLSRQAYSRHENSGTIPLDKLILICKHMGLCVVVLPKGIVQEVV